METWIQPDFAAATSSQLTMETGCEFINLSRPVGRGGGLGLLYKPNYFSVTNLNVNNYNNFELLACNVKSPTLSWNVYVVYRPPPPNINNDLTFHGFMIDFHALLSSVNQSSTPTTILGDFNLHLDCPSTKETSDFLHMLDEFNLVQLVRDPTHDAGHTLDCIITNANCILPHLNIRTINTGLSDHFLILFNILTIKPVPIQVTTTSRYLRQIDPSAFKEDLSNVFSDLSSSTSSQPDNLVSEYNKRFTSVLNTHAPLRPCTITKRKHPLTGWFTPKIADAKRKRRRLERRWRFLKNGRHESSLVHKAHDAYIAQSKALTSMIESAKTQFYSTSILKASNNPKELFQRSNKLLGLNTANKLPPNISDSQLANDFAKYFQTKISCIRNTIPTNIPLRKVAITDSPRNYKLLRFLPINESCLNKIIFSLKPTTCLLDPVPTHLLRSYACILTKFLVHLVNTSLDTGLFPQKLKSAIVTPILKKPNLPTELSNYRPVSNLPFLAKILERVVFNQLNDYIVTNKLNSCYQSGFTALHSTETALIKVQADILNSLDAKRMCIVVFLDLSAAFDTVDHTKLLTILTDKFGICDKAHDWLASYLSGRNYIVKVNDSLSHPVEVKYGVPQGSVLGPLLFKLYISSLSNILESHDVQFHFFADDSQLYVDFDPRCSASLIASINSIEKCVADVRYWLGTHFLKCNDSKTEVLLVGSSHNLSLIPTVNIKVGDNIIISKPYVRNLGAHFDSTLRMDKFVANKCQSANYYLRNIYKIRSLLSPDATKALVYAYVISRLNYCNTLLYGVSGYHLHKLQLIQNSAARCIYNIPSHDHITPVLQTLQWLPINKYITFKIAVLVFKSLHQILPTYLCDLIIVKQPGHYNLRSLNNITFIKPNSTNSFGLRSFSYSAPHVWNALPASVRRAPTLASFIDRAKAYYLLMAYDKS